MIPVIIAPISMTTHEVKSKITW